MAETKEKNGGLFILLAAFLWSLSGIFTKSLAWNGLCLATLRGVIAFLVALIIIHGRKIELNRTKVLCGICCFVQGTLFMCANKYTTAGNATVLQNTSPLFIILMNAVFNNKRPSKREITICVILFIGVGLAFAGSLGGGAWLGNILAMLSAVFYAGVYFLSKQEGADPVESLVIGNAFYLLLIPLLVTDPVVRSTTPQQWLFLIAGTVTGIGAWLCFSIGIKYTSALQAGFIALLEPVMAPIWTFLFLGERISPLSLTGIAIVILTLLGYNIGLSRRVVRTNS